LECAVSELAIGGATEIHLPATASACRGWGRYTVGATALGHAPALGWAIRQSVNVTSLVFVYWIKWNKLLVVVAHGWFADKTFIRSQRPRTLALFALPSSTAGVTTSMIAVTGFREGFHGGRSRSNSVTSMARGELLAASLALLHLDLGEASARVAAPLVVGDAVASVQALFEERVGHLAAPIQGRMADPQMAALLASVSLALRFAAGESILW